MAGRISYYGGIVKNGLIFDLDVAKRDCYPGSGTVIREITGTNVIGTLINGPTFSLNNGGSITFDGTDDYVRINPNNIQPSAELSIESWFNSFGSNSRVQGIFYANYGLGLRLNPTGQMHSRVNSGEVSYQNTTTTTYFNNRWNHVVLTINSTQAKLYINSSFLEQYSISYSGSNINSASIGGFGSDVNDSANRGFYGNVSVCRAYNKVLTDQEVLQNYNALKGRYGL